MSEVQIDAEVFARRMRTAVKAWREDTKANGNDGLFGGADALVVQAGKYEEEHMFHKTNCLHDWLFGVYFADTVFVVTEGAVHVVAGEKKLSLMEPLKKELAKPGEKGGDLEMHFYPRNKADNNQANYENVTKAIKGKKLGVFAKEIDSQTQGPVFRTWREFIKGSDLVEVNAAPGWAGVFARKESDEHDTMRLSAKAAAKGANYLQQEMEKSIEAEKMPKHAKLSQKVENHILSNSSSFGIKGLDADSMDIAYPPIVQSGQNFDLKMSAQSDAKAMDPSVIIASVGVRYDRYCSTLSRTYLIDASKERKEKYKALVGAFDAGLAALKDGAMCKDVYAAVKSHLKQKKPGLEEHLTKNVGAGIGLEVRESYAILSSKSVRKVEDGMVVQLRVGLKDLSDDDDDDENYSMMVADTVLVTSKGAEVLTSASMKKQSEVCYSFNEEEANGKASTKGSSRGAVVEELGPRRARKVETTVDDDTAVEEQQKALGEKLNEEAMKRILGNGKNESDDTKTKAVKKVVAYQSISQFPKAVAPRKIFVDMERETVLFPIRGVPVPFHISMIKNVTKPEEISGLSHYTLRINFFAPPANANTEPWVGEAQREGKAFVKQMSYRSSDPANLNLVFRNIKELRKRYTQRIADLKEREDLVEQADLITCRGRPHARLRELTMRPNLNNQRKTLGELQAHENGFRFVSMKGQQIDILYNNIKHALFQPARKEPIVIIHFNLKHKVMIGRKKHEDLQFFTEVGEQSSDLSSISARDGFEEEHRERMQKKRINEAFKKFCTIINDMQLLGNGKEFDVPYHELGFDGVAGKTSSYIQPSVHCLCDLFEFPATVITLSEVELVSLERVDFSLRNFDVAFIFKDYKKPVKLITTVDKSNLDKLKKWFTQVNIKYYEGNVNLQWNSIMKHINSDPTAFFEKEGGWSFLDAEGSEDELDELEDESSEGFQTPSDEEDSGSDEDSDFSDVSDDDSMASIDEEEEEEGLDWDELEEKAKRADAEEGESDEDRRRPSKSSKSHSRSRPSKKARRR